MNSSTYQNEYEGKTALLVKSFFNKNGYQVKVMLYEEETPAPTFTLLVYFLNRIIPDKVVFQPNYARYKWKTHISLYKWSYYGSGQYSYSSFYYYVVLTEKQLRELFETYLLQHPERDIRLSLPQSDNNFSFHQSRLAKNFGYIYILQCQITKLVKIGKTKDLRKRIREMKNMSPTPLKIVTVYECEYAKELDEYLCRDVFGYRNDHSEWFKLSDEELDRFLLARLPYPANEFLIDVRDEVKGKVLDYSWFLNT